MNQLANFCVASKDFRLAHFADFSLIQTFVSSDGTCVLDYGFRSLLYVWHVFAHRRRHGILRNARNARTIS